jgi:hypothetical protein
VTAHVFHAPPSPGDSALVSSINSLFLVFFFFFFFSCFCVCISLVSLVQYTCVLLKFYWNFSWLDARSAIFYLRVCVNIRETQM